jgi:hypothetical protein
MSDVTNKTLVSLVGVAFVIVVVGTTFSVVDLPSFGSFLTGAATIGDSSSAFSPISAMVMVVALFAAIAIAIFMYHRKKSSVLVEASGVGEKNTTPVDDNPLKNN